MKSFSVKVIGDDIVSRLLTRIEETTNTPVTWLAKTVPEYSSLQVTHYEQIKQLPFAQSTLLQGREPGTFSFDTRSLYNDTFSYKLGNKKSIRLGSVDVPYAVFQDAIIIDKGIESGLLPSDEPLVQMVAEIYGNVLSDLGAFR